VASARPRRKRIAKWRGMRVQRWLVPEAAEENGGGTVPFLLGLEENEQ
jgi:hypothetical protein